MTRRILLVLALLLGAWTVVPGSANAVEASDAACEPPAPPQSAAIQGFGSWFLPVTPTNLTHSWSMSLEAECTSGTGHDVGVYDFDLSGSSIENCAGGEGTGSIDGEGPEGDLGGSLTFVKVGVHYYITGNMTMGGHSHNLNLWVDVIPQINTNNICYYDNAAVFGHGNLASVSDT